MSTTRTWYNHLPAPVDPSRYGPSPNLRRHADGPDAFNVRCEPRVNDRRHAVGTIAPVGFGFGYASELYRMRTQPHLYDDLHVDSSLDLAREEALRQHAALADCHTCQATRTVDLDEDDPTCGTCGGELG